MTIDSWFEWFLWIATVLQALLILPLVVRSARGILSSRPNQPHWRSDLAVTFLMLGTMFRSISLVSAAHERDLQSNTVIAFVTVFLTLAILNVLIETTRERDRNE